MRIARFIRPAEDEMIEAAVYYESQVIGLGEKFIETIERALFEIEKKPTLWPKEKYNIRRRVLSRFPFSILYVIDEDELVIVAIAHQRRRPHYWVGRL